MAEHAYLAQQILVRPMRTMAQPWRLVLGLVLIVFLTLMLVGLMQSIALRVVPGISLQASSIGQNGNSALGLIFLLGSYLGLSVAVFLTVVVLHKRPALSVIGPIHLSSAQFVRVLWGLVLLFAVIWILPPWDMGEPLVAHMRLGAWLALLPVSLLVVLIQTSAEEILFRGYLQQTLAARFSHPLIWMGLPSALFAFGHYAPAEAGENALLIALWAGVFGALMADLTARAGTLGPAIAVHMMNNVVALLLISFADSLGGLSLYHLPYGMENTGELRAWLAADFGFMLVSWLAARLAIRR